MSAEMAIQQAADFLNVPRSYLGNDLESGDLSCHGIGEHRRVRLNDLLVYKARRDQENERAMAELA